MSNRVEELLCTRDTMGLAARAIQDAIGRVNVVKLTVDVSIPDTFRGRMDLCEKNLLSICTLLSGKLVNGLIYVEIIMAGKLEDRFDLLFEIRATDEKAGSNKRPIFSSSNEVSDFINQLPLVSVWAGPDDPVFRFQHSFSCVSDVKLDQDRKLQALKVLLAEDNEVNAMVFASFLEEWGCEVTIVPNGEEAVSSFLRNQYDLVLMDIYMPVLNGKEAIRRIRSNGSQIPIIALTASALEMDYRDALEAGANSYLQKPIVGAQLYAMIQKYA